MTGGKETGFKDVNIVKPNSTATQNTQQAEIEEPLAGSSNVQQSPTGRSPEHMIDHWKSFLAVSSKEPSKNLQQNISPKTQTSQLSDISQSQHNKDQQYNYSNVGTIISLPNNTVQFQKSETSPVNIVTSHENRTLTVDPKQYGNPDYQVHTAGKFQNHDINTRHQSITFANSSSQPESNVSSPEHRLVIAENIEQSVVPTKKTKSNVNWNMEKLVQNDADMSTEKNKILTNLHNNESKLHQGILKSTQPAKEQHNRSYFYGSQGGQQISEPEKRVNLMFKQPAQQHDMNTSVQDQRNLQKTNYQSPPFTLATPQNIHQMQLQSQYLYSAHQPSQTHGQQPPNHENNYPNLQVNQEQYTPHNPFQQPKYLPNLPNQQPHNPPSIVNQHNQYPPNTSNQTLQYQSNLPNQQLQYQHNLPNQQLQYQTDTTNQHPQYSPNTPYQQVQYSPNMANQQLMCSPITANQQLQNTPTNTAYQHLQHAPTNTANQQLQHAPQNTDNQQLQHAPQNTGNQQLQHAPQNTGNQQLQHATPKHTAYQKLHSPPNTANQKLQHSPTNTVNQQLQHAPPNTGNQQLQNAQPKQTAYQKLQHAPPKTANQQPQYSQNTANQQLQYSPNTGNQQLQHTSMHMANQQPPYSPNTAYQQLSNTLKKQPPYSPNTADQSQLYSSNITSQQLLYSPAKVEQQLPYPENISSQQFGFHEQYPPNKANEEQVSQLKHESFNKNIADQQDFQQSGQKHESFNTDQPLTQDNHHQQVAKIERGQHGQNRIEIHHSNLNMQPTAQQIQNQQTQVQKSSLVSQELQHTQTQNGSLYAHAALSPFTKQTRSTGGTVEAENQHAGQRSTILDVKVTDDHKKEKIQSQKRKIQSKHTTKDSIQKIELDFIASPPVLFTPEYLMLKIPKQETTNAKAVSNEIHKRRGQSPVDGSESLEAGPVKKLKLEEVRISTANIDQYPESEFRRSVQINKRGFKKYLLSKYEEDKRMIAHSKTKIQCEKTGPPPNKDSVLHATSNIPLKRTYASCDLAPKGPTPDCVGNSINEHFAMSVANKENTKISRNDINVMFDKEKNTESSKLCNEQSSVLEPILSDLENTSTSFPTENGSEISLNQIRLDLAMSSDSSVASDHEKSFKNDNASQGRIRSDPCSEIADCADSGHLLGHEDISTNSRDKNNHTSSKPVTVISTFFSQITNQTILKSFNQGRNVGFLIDFNPRRFGIVEHEDHHEQNFNAIPAKPTFSYRKMTENQRWNNLLAVRNTAQKFTQTV
ncbi:putative mediator of RNA polymerase II transcription subunit 26 isoform X2 [Mytilus trossulus]|uniref:putative mediator of RNA polymerase II transcription subunit 26 isoform X2 n=1 Tax=Mytilus trossulus TaxID=6551 RepID=UPI0030047F21